MSNDTHKQYKDLGELQTLLLRACPANSEGFRSIPTLAEKLGITHQYVYQWIEKNRVPQKFVRPLVDLGQGVSVEDFIPYTFQ